MGVLTQRQILERIKGGGLFFRPGLDKFQVQMHSVDLKLGFTFMIPKVWHSSERGREVVTLDPLRTTGTPNFEVVELEQGQYFDLLPQEYVLVSTLETIGIPKDLMAVLYPRSSINRKGLSIDLTGIIDAGYEGQLTMPIRNNTRGQTIRLYPGERFCQLVFQPLAEEVEVIKSRHHKRDIADGLAPENENEVDLIMKGDINKLKETYPVGEESAD